MRTEYYKDYWQNAQLEVSTYTTWKSDLARSHPAVQRAHAVLDVGAGAGAILAAVQRPGLRACAIEISPDAVKALEARGIEAAAVDLEQERLPHPDRTFDVVFCFDVFEHLFAPDALLREIRRVLKDDGHALLCVPNTLNAFNRLMFALGDFVDVMDTDHQTNEMFSNHIRMFSKGLFERFLSTGGFTPKAKNFYFPPKFTDPRFRLPSGFASIVTGPGLERRMPTLFALSFFYDCVKAAPTA